MPRNTLAARARRRLPGIRAALVLPAVALLLTGCATDFFEKPPPPPKPLVDHKAASAEALVDDFAVLDKLIDAPPEQQMQMVGSAEQDFQATPTPSKKLRLALILGTPDQAGSDLPRAQEMLEELSSDPQQSSLLPGERSLVALQLKQIGDYLTLEAENRTLQADATRADQLAALKHRLDGAAGENAKLKKELDEAKAKLAAIANIEKSLNERKPNEGRPK